MKSWALTWIHFERRLAKPLMNILTFDVEDWFHLLDHPKTEHVSSWGKFESRICGNLDRILDHLDSREQKATFFCLGWIAEQYPELIRKIDAHGHEIGSHSYGHQLAYKQTAVEFRDDLRRSMCLIADITGKTLNKYRAPGFSLTQQSVWLLRVLVEEGIETDCSVFPTSRGHGGLRGFSSAPAVIRTSSGPLKELPINLFSIPALGGLVFSGGGYFRLLPWWLVRRLVSSSPYVMTYFHPRDFDPGQPVLNGLSPYRKFKSYYGLGGAFKKLEMLIDEFDFVDVDTAVSAIDWSNVPVIEVSS